MTYFKCKMCGGTLGINNNETVVECEYCGTQQTLPKLDDEKRTNLYDRANHFRRNNEFDKAMGIYEKILNEDRTDAEAYWSLVLCRYGIEYVEDPISHKRVPTVNRVQYTSIFDDDNYKSALNNADSYQKAIYEQEAKTINEIQKGILAISQKEDPFDVFICYKETDNNGRRTHDSVLANDLYHQLTQEGFRVFFSRITLEDKLGTAYEPYIFAALNSAKVMVVLGTRPEYFNAVWVKNEWSRYLALIKNGAKKMLIPAYKDMDPYDLPEEFSHLQAQDMSKLGFMQDLIRGIKKIIDVEVPKTVMVKETVINGGNTNAAPLLKRAFMFCEDEDFDSADKYFEKVLDIDPECAEAYLGKLMVEYRIDSREKLKECSEPFNNSDNYEKTIRFADDNLKNELQSDVDFIVNRNLTNAYNDAVQLMEDATTEEAYKRAATEFSDLYDFGDSQMLAKECLKKAEEARLTVLYNEAITQMDSANTEEQYKSVSEKFNYLKSFRDAEIMVKVCLEKAEISRKDVLYDSAISSMKVGTLSAYKKAIDAFKTIEEWKDSSIKINECVQAIYEIEKKEEAERIEIEKSTKKRKKIIMIATPIIIAIVIATSVLFTSIIPDGKYNKAVALMSEKKYAEAISIFKELGGYKDSGDKIEKCLEVYDIGVNVGDTYKFGSYEQDNNESNGKEDIEWLVVSKEGTKILVISKYVLDFQKYNISNEDVTWETCTLRKWLNHEFLNNAFTGKERSMIPTTKVLLDENSDDTDSYNETNTMNNTTQDKVFLFNENQARMYLISAKFKSLKLTNYCEAKEKSDDKFISTYMWLRFSGKKEYDEDSDYADCLYGGNSDNKMEFNTAETDTVELCVRPALWIDLIP